MSTANTTKQQVIRAACYLRISSDPNDKRAGVTRQKEDTTAMCEVLSTPSVLWAPVEYYIDNDRSASNGKRREDWERLLSDIDAGERDAIVVWNQDRGWRKMSDLESLRPVLEPRGVLLATTNLGVIDVRNADDVFRAQISTAMSEMEVAKMKVRMRRAARQKAEQGKPQWKRAFGFLGDTYELDPKTAPLVKDAYAAIRAGASLKDICCLFNDVGAYGLNRRPWTPTTVSLFLRKPRNAGLRAHNGEIVTDSEGQPVKGTWPALVDETTWRAAQDVFNAPARKKPGRKSVRQHPLTGVMRCGRQGCDGYLAGNWVMQPTGGQSGRLKAGETRAVSEQVKHSITYSCRRCHCVSVRAEHVVPLLYRVVGGRLAQPDAVDLLKAEIRDEREAERIRLELTTLYERRARIGVDLGNGVIDGKTASIAIDTVDTSIAKLEREQQSQERLRVFDGIPLGKPEVVDAIRRLSDDRFRAVLDVLCTVTVLPVGKSGKLFNPDRILIEPKH